MRTLSAQDVQHTKGVYMGVGGLIWSTLFALLQSHWNEWECGDLGQETEVGLDGARLTASG